MRNHQKALLGTVQIVFEPLNHVEVEVVGRLVENKQIGTAYQHIGKSYALNLSARELRDWLVEVANLQLRQNSLGATLVVPRIVLLHLRDERIESRIAGCLYTFLVFLYEFGNSITVLEASLYHGQPFGISRSLFEISNREVVPIYNRAAVLSLLAHKNAQKSGFTGSVLGYQTNTLSLGKTEGQILEQHLIAERLCQVLNL